MATLDSFSHLISLVNVEDKPRRLAEDEDDHDGEEEGCHGIVPPVAGAQGVVKGGVARIQCDSSEWNVENIQQYYCYFSFNSN